MLLTSRTRWRPASTFNTSTRAGWTGQCGCPCMKVPPLSNISMSPFGSRCTSCCPQNTQLGWSREMWNWSRLPPRIHLVRPVLRSTPYTDEVLRDEISTVGSLAVGGSTELPWK